MLLEIGLIAAGAPLGYALRGCSTAKRLALPALTATVWYILFAQGILVGANDDLVARAGSLGLRAAVLWLLCFFGSALAALIMAKTVFPDALTIKPQNSSEKNSGSLKSSVCVLCCFFGGILLGLSGVYPYIFVHPVIMDAAFYAMLILAGSGIGFDLKAFGIIRELKGKILLIPLGAHLGTLAACLAVWLIFGDMPLNEYAAAGSACCYYSLGSPLLTKLGGPELGALTLVANMLREVSTIVFCPLLVRFFGRLAPICCGGAAAMDSCLAATGRTCGERYAIISLFSGTVISVAVPILLPLLMSL